MFDNTSIFLQAMHVQKQVMSGDKTLTILQDVNLTVKSGESIAILGASGSGKTTLLTLLSGLDLPTAGDIYFQQQRINQLDEEQRAILRGKQIGFIFQSFELLPNLTALENVLLPLEIQSIPNEQAQQRAIGWLTELGLQQRLHHYPTKLSGGEQQRVAIARAFVTQPNIIFADEMTGNLDVHTGAVITDLLFTLNRQHHTTLVLVTHDELLAARCERRYLLREGKLQLC